MRHTAYISIGILVLTRIAAAIPEISGTTPLELDPAAVSTRAPASVREVIHLYAPRVKPRAAEGEVLSVSYAFALTSKDVAPERDYYLDLGASAGLGVGALVGVYRRVSAADGRLGTTFREFSVHVGDLKIVSVTNDASVARVEKLSDAKEIAFLTYQKPMIGDSVRLKTDLPSSATVSTLSK